MRVVNKDYDKIITKNNPCVFYVFSDTHVGNIGFNEKLLDAQIEMCRREDALWIHGGDWIEGIAPDDPRFDIRLVGNKDITEQYEMIADKFYPIRKNCICILSGNHDEKLSKKYGDGVATIGRRLNVRYLGYSGFINLRLWHQENKLKLKKNPNYSFKIFCYHGRGAGRTIGSKINNIYDLSHQNDANMYIFAHTHTFAYYIDIYKQIKGDKLNKSRIHKKKRYYISPPSYLDGYTEAKVSSYVEKGAYQEMVVGCVRVELYRDGNKIGVNVRPILG